MLHRITLHLARDPRHPEGSAAEGYEILAPLDGSGHLDTEEWKSLRGHCRVRRFRPGESSERGRLVHRPGGADGATWTIDYDDRTTDDDEAGYRLGDHRFALGEYVSLRDAGGRSRTYRVADLQRVGIAAAGA